jgi:hypothetical protein
VEVELFFGTILALGTIAATVIGAVGLRVISKLDSLVDKIESMVTKEACASHRKLISQMLNHHYHENNDLIIKRVPIDANYEED